MSTTSVTTLSAGLQELYDKGFLPTGLTKDTLKSTSAAKLNQLAATSIAAEQIGVLLGNSPNDTASLSSTAQSAWLNESNGFSTGSSSSMDHLTAAVNDQLTATLNAAVSKFLPSSSPAGSVNVLG